MKRFVLPVVTAIAAMGLALFAPSTEAGETIELNIGSLAPKGTPWMDMLLEMEKRVESQSGGAINMIIRPPGVMSEVEMVRETRSAERLQACAVTTAAVAEGGNLPVLQLAELPFLFDSNDEADHIMDDVLFGEVSGVMRRRGFQLIAISENGWRSFATKGKPVRTPADLATFKMRSQESDVHMAMYKAFGANAIQKPMTEVLTSLQSNVVDGLDNTALYILAAGLAEPIDYFTVSNHIYQPAAIVLSAKWYAGLSDDHKKIFDNLRELGPISRAAIRTEEANMVESLAMFDVEIVKLTDAERQVFVDKARAIHTDFAAGIDGGPELLNTINAALKAKRGQ